MNGIQIIVPGFRSLRSETDVTCETVSKFDDLEVNPGLFKLNTEADKLMIAICMHSYCIVAEVIIKLLSDLICSIIK